MKHYAPALSTGLFCVTRSNRTRQLTDPTLPYPLQVEKIEPNYTQLNTSNNGAYSLAVTSFYTKNLSRTFSHYHLITPSGRFPVPVRSAVKSNLTAWCYQILSNRALNALT